MSTTEGDTTTSTIGNKTASFCRRRPSQRAAPVSQRRGVLTGTGYSMLIGNDVTAAAAGISLHPSHCLQCRSAHSDDDRTRRKTIYPTNCLIAPQSFYSSETNLFVVFFITKRYLTNGCVYESRCSCITTCIVQRLLAACERVREV